MSRKEHIFEEGTPRRSNQCIATLSNRRGRGGQDICFNKRLTSPVARQSLLEGTAVQIRQECLEREAFLFGFCDVVHVLENDTPFCCPN